MDEQKIRESLEGLDIPSEKIDELIVVMKDLEEHPLKDGDKIGDMTISILADKIKEEPDWRKRASMAARIISANLE